jgi:lysophospholipase L1-like esterase
LIELKVRKILCLATVVVVLTSLYFVVPEANASPVIKVMPLGDSITVGYPGLDGYRTSLYQNLISSHFLVNFVGSQNNGTGLDNDNEGHLGYSATQINDNVIGWLDNNPADIVLLHIGTNDIESGQNAASIVTEVSSILDKIDQWESVHGQVTVVLARIILRCDNANWNTTTKTFDDALQTMAQARVDSGDKIIVVDMENALNYSTDMTSDGIHPNLSGYTKMASVWYNALVKNLGYSLTVNYVGQGVVTKIPEQSAYPPDLVVNLTAKPNEGWAFSSWSGDLVSSISSENITMDNDKIVTAIFKPLCKLTISSNYGSTTPLAGDYWYAEGTNVTIAASPPTMGANERFNWLNWTGSGLSSYSGTSNNITITMNSSVNETAFWLHEYELTISSNSGIIAPPAGEYWYQAGTPVTLTASPPTSSGIRASWAGWSGSGVNSYTGYVNPITLTMNSPVTENASWNVEYKLTVATNIGTTQPSTGETWLAAGTVVNAETSPPTEQTGVQYICMGWSGTGSVPATGSNSNLVFTINSPSNISWTWKTQYYLNVTSPYGTTDGTGWYDADTTAYATICPIIVMGEEGVRFTFDGWSDESSGGPLPSRAIFMDGPKTATAIWKTQYLVTFVISPLEAATISSDTTVWKDNGKISISVSPNKAYSFSLWSTDTSNLLIENPNSASTSVTITGPGTITAILIVDPAHTTSSTHEPTAPPSPQPTPGQTTFPSSTANTTASTTSKPSDSSSTSESFSIGEYTICVTLGLIAGITLVSTIVYSKKNKKFVSH